MKNPDTSGSASAEIAAPTFTVAGSGNTSAVMNKGGSISIGIPTSSGGGFGVSAPDASVNVPNVKAPQVKGDAGMGEGIGFSAPEGSIEVPDMKGDAGMGGGISVPSMEVPDIPDMEVPTFDMVNLFILICLQLKQTKIRLYYLAKWKLFIKMQNIKIDVLLRLIQFI